MKKRFILLMLLLAAFLSGSAYAAQTVKVEDARIEFPASTTVFRSEDSTTGYEVTFVYDNPDATEVKIRGEWSFSDARNSSLYTSLNATPNEYENGMFPLQIDAGDEWLIEDMECDAETGVWRYTIPLPCGVWSYRFIVTTEDGMFETSDPNNRPVERAPGQQTNSQVYVPFDPERQIDDWSIQFPRTDGKTGTLDMIYFDASDLDYELLDEPSVAVYLPYGYDENREEPYRILYALHGSGIESETSWWNKGVIGNLTDNLVADYGIEPFVIVMPNSYADSFDYNNITERVIPLVEENYNVSTNEEDRAICGISMGAIAAKNILLNTPEEFRYYGLFSGAYFSESTEVFDGKRISDRKVYLAAGEREDGLIAVYRTADKLANAGLTGYHLYTVMGGHNWYTWRQIYVDFVLNELWG